MLEVKHLTKSFGGLAAVNNVTMNVQKNEIVGLIGPNGAGKTTIFNLIHGQIKPDSGSVSFKGQEVIGLKPHQLNKLGMARSFQLLRLFNNLTVEENIRAGRIVRTGTFSWKSLLNLRPSPPGNSPSQERDHKIDTILDFVGLDEMRNLPTERLSQAHRKRLEIARALATEPDLILLDEPSTGLNDIEVSELITLIQRVRDKGITLLIIEHVMKFIMNISDRIVVLNMGVVICEGKPKDVCEDKTVIQAYLGEQFARS